MDQEGSIKYSDLLIDDGALDKGIEKMKNLIDIYNTMFDTIKEKAKDSKGVLDGVVGIDKKQQDQIAKLIADIQKLKDEQRSLDEQNTNATKALALLNNEKREQAKINKLISQLNDAEKGSYQALDAQYKLNQLSLKKMNEDTIKNTKAGRDLKRETDELRESLKAWNAISLDTNQAINIQSKSYEQLVQEYSESKAKLDALRSTTTGFSAELLELENSHRDLGEQVEIAYGKLEDENFTSTEEKVISLSDELKELARASKSWFNDMQMITEGEFDMPETQGKAQQQRRELTKITQDIETAQRKFNEALDEGAITLEEYSKYMDETSVASERVNERLTLLDSVIADNGNSMNQFAEMADQSFIGLDESAMRYVEANKEIEVELRKIKDLQKNLNKDLKSGAISQEKYNEATHSLSIAEKELTSSRNANNKVIALHQQLVNSEVGSYENLSAQYALLKIRINEMGEAEEAEIAGKRELEKQAKALYEQMSQLQQQTGRHQLEVGKYEKSMDDLNRTIAMLDPTMGMLMSRIKALSFVKSKWISINKSLSTSLGISAKQANILQMAVVGLVIGGVIYAIKYFKEWFDENRKLKMSFEQLHDVIGKSKDEIASTTATYETLRTKWNALGDDLKAKEQFIIDNKDAFEKLGLSVKDVTTAENVLVTNTATVMKAMRLRAEANAMASLATDKYAEYLQKTADADARWQAPTFMETLEDMGNATLSQLEGILNLVKYGNYTGESIFDQGVKASEKMKDEADKSYKAFTKSIEEQVKKEKEALDLLHNIGVITKEEADIQKKQAEEKARLDKEALAKRKKAMEDAKKMNKQSIEWARQLRDSEIAILDEGLKKEEERLIESYQRQMADLETKYSEQELMIAGSEEKKNATILNLQTKLDKELMDLRLKDKIIQMRDAEQILRDKLELVKQGSIEEQSLRTQLLESQRQIELSENRLLVESKRKDEDLINKRYDKMILDSDRKLGYEREMQSYTQAEALAKSEFDIVEHSEREKTVFILQQQKKRIEMMLKLHKDGMLELTQAQIDTYKNQMALLDQEMDKAGKKDIWSVLGMDLKDEQKQALETSFSFAKDALNSYMDYKMDIVNQNMQIADRAVDKAERNLDREIQLMSNGYAHNVSNAQRELELARKTQQQAQKDQQKALKQKQQLESINQATSMVTASALIWSQLGFPAALPALAIMWGSFAYSKIKASQMTKMDSQEYGDGGFEFLSGGSHQSGRDINIGMTQDGKNRRAEGGETLAIFNKKATRKYRRFIPDLINGVNNMKIDDLMSPNFGASGLNVSVDGGWDASKIEKYLERILDNQQKGMFIYPDGTMVVKDGNNTRIVKR